MAESSDMVYSEAKVHFTEGYASVYDRVELLPNGWVSCGGSPYGPELFPPGVIESIDAGYDG